MKIPEIKIEAIVNVDLSKAWNYWTAPEHITRWNFAADDWHCPEAENDLQPGGKFRSRMEAQDGSFGFDFCGVYDEIIPNKKIAYTMEDGRQAITEFEDQGGQILITTTFDPENENPAEMQQQGWQAILNNFKTYVEG